MSGRGRGQRSGSGRLTSAAGFLRRALGATAREREMAHAEADRRTARLRRRNQRLVRRNRELEGELDGLRVVPKPAQPDVVAGGRSMFEALRRDGTEPHVVLVLHGYTSSLVFAGITTAVQAASHLSVELQMNLRLVIFDTDEDASSIRRSITSVLRSRPEHRRLADHVRISTRSTPDSHGHHVDDVWLATYWTTAEVLGEQARAGAIDRDRVVYLVQDFEPGFHPWGDLYNRALTTYDSGFRSLVNSRSLSRYLADNTGLQVDPRAVFAPSLEFTLLHEAAARWEPSPDGAVRLLFYARPGKPRNMYQTGLEALRIWAAALPEGQRAVVRLAGEDMTGQVDLGPRVSVEMLGKVTMDRYYEILSRTDVGLALMLSPHPGHLALELPAAGIPTVTNQFAGHREPWVDGLWVVSGGASAIADQLIALCYAQHQRAPASYDLDLGSSLEEAVGHLATGLRQHA